MHTSTLMCCWSPDAPAAPPGVCWWICISQAWTCPASSQCWWTSALIQLLLSVSSQAYLKKSTVISVPGPESIFSSSHFTLHERPTFCPGTIECRWNAAEVWLCGSVWWNWFQGAATDFSVGALGAAVRFSTCELTWFILRPDWYIVYSRAGWYINIFLKDIWNLTILCILIYCNLNPVSSWAAFCSAALYIVYGHSAQIYQYMTFGPWSPALVFSRFIAKPLQFLTC